MKFPILLPLIVLAGCAAPKTGRVTVTPRSTTVAPEELSTTVRYPEVIDYTSVATLTRRIGY